MLGMSNIIYHTGNIIDTTQPAIGHGINTFFQFVGGITQELRNEYGNYILYPYYEACYKRKLKPGIMVPSYIEYADKWVLNLAIQKLSFHNPNIEWFRSALQQSFQFVSDKGLKGFAIPHIGAGHKGLKKEEVEPIILEIAERFPNVELEIWVRS